MHRTTIRPIHNEHEYEFALKQIEQLMDAEGEDADTLEALAILVEDYERRRDPMRLPDPIAYLNIVMEARGLIRKDLEPFIGGRSREAEILNRRRPLTLDMIRRLHEGLALDLEVLVQPYKLAAPRPRVSRRHQDREIVKELA